MGFLSEGTSFHYTTLELVKECTCCEQSVIFFPILADIPNLKYQCLPIFIIDFWPHVKIFNFFVIKSLFFGSIPMYNQDLACLWGISASVNNSFVLLATHFITNLIQYVNIQ
jgi:hypothetical protein